MQLLFAILISGSAMGQPYLFTASLPDRDAGHSSTASGGTQNTGYDILGGLGVEVNGLPIGCTFTATVWDGDLATHKGGIFLTKGRTEAYSNWHNLLGYELKDPDVVVGYFGKSLRWALVGISAEDGKVHFVTGGYGCNEMGEMVVAKSSDCALGSVSAAIGTTGTSYGSFGSSGRQCSSPNIDANSAGQIAIVWQESISYTFVFHVDAPVGPFKLASPGYNFTTTTGESNIFAVHGYLDGFNPDSTRSLCDSTEYNFLSGRMNNGNGDTSSIKVNYFNITAQSGEYSATNSVHFTYNPDVAIGQGSNPFVSYSYMNNGQLNVYQHHWGAYPDVATDNYYHSYTGFVGERPRIAAKPSSSDQTDFVVVGGQGFTTDCPGYTPSGFITAVWKEGILSQTAAETLNTPLNLTGQHNFEPVVAYYTDHDGDYYASQSDPDLADSWVVAWTINNATVTGGSLEGDGYDVIARHFKVDGTPLESHNLYSFVNENKTTTGMHGNQRVPSIASRYGVGATGYAFNDDYITEAITKVAFENYAGTDHLQYDGRGDCTACGPDGGDSKRLKPSNIKVYPNPGQGSFGIKLTPSDKSEQAVIIVTDAKGNVLLKQEWNKSQGEPKVVLKDLPAGLYNVQFTTPDGVSRRSLYNNQK